MYNTSRGGGGGEGGGVDVKKWLADNKLSDVEKVFLEREIQIEELAEFQEAELMDFAKDLGLDTLQRRRFVKAIQDMRKAKEGPPSYGESGGGGGGGLTTTGLRTTTNTNTISGFGTGTSSSFGEGSMNTFSSRTSSNNIHVLMSPQEHKAMNKLTLWLEKSTTLLQQLSQAPASLKTSLAECDHDTNEKFDRIASVVEDKRRELLRHVERLKAEKEIKLKEQLGILLQYQQIIAAGKQEYEIIMANSQLDISSRKKEVVRMTQEILNRKGVNLVISTQPKMQLTFEPLILEKFLRDLEIDDCDQPHAPIISVGKITFNTAIITWQMSHPSLVAKVEEFSIEFAKVRKAEKKKSKTSKKSKKKGKKKKGSDDSDSEEASDSEEDSEEEESDKGKKKRGNKDDEKKNEKELALDEDGLENAGKDFTEEELVGLQWSEAEVIKAQKGKFRLENGGWEYNVRNLKDSIVYAIRVRGRNKSGWGAYSSAVKATTKELTIDSAILKAKEKAALLKFVSKKERKKRWRLLFRASKDGFASSQFHAKCDNKGVTVTVVHSTSNHVFGGYTTLPWQSGSGSYQNDANAFIFLLRSSNKL